MAQWIVVHENYAFVAKRHCHSRNFSVNGYTLGRNDMAQVVGFLLEDQKFAQLSLQAFMLQSLQNNLLPSKVLCESG